MTPPEPASPKPLRDWDRDTRQYRELNAAKIVLTVNKLAKRIRERFPDFGLAEVANELRFVALDCGRTAQSLGKPYLGLRLLSFLVCAILIGLSIVIFMRNRESLSVDHLSDFQLLEAIIQDIIFLILAIFFFTTLERRAKRARALRDLHSLRSLAHIIDMHQLTKDPDTQSLRAGRTPSSPERNLSGFELKRYFDYCSEMLSLISKLAALYVQRFDDPVTLAAVTEIENLTNGLSRKIWQKIMLTTDREAPEQRV